MRVLVACEYSGTVRDAFTRRGHDAISCDFLPTESPGPHYQGDVRDIINDGFDLMIAHPSCTYMASAGNRWLYDQQPRRGLTGPARWEALIEAAVFLRYLLDAPVPRVAIENPRMNRHAAAIIGRGPDQTVQPWQFGHTESKGVSLWLRGLPALEPTHDVHSEMMQLPERERSRVHWTSPGVDRAKVRSLFFRGIADAMADQWGAATQIEVAA